MQTTAHNEKRPVYVVKYGGAAMTDLAVTRRLLSELASLQRDGFQIVLVHGGGPEIDRMLLRLSMEPKKLGGFRVTDAPTMEVVEMVLAGRVNKGLVGMLTAFGARAVGLSGRDGRLLLAKRKIVTAGDLGLVGTVVETDAELLELLLQGGYLPVVCSIATERAEPEGHPLNINADEAASALAAALGAARLLLLTDVPGVMTNYPDPSSLVPQLTQREAEGLVESGAISEGMLPKIEACLTGIRAGVQTVQILDGRRPELIRHAIMQESGVGTVFVP